MDENIEIFKASRMVKFYHFLFVIALCALISIFMKNFSFRNTYIFLVVISLAYLFYIGISKNLTSVYVDKGSKIVKFYFNQFVFFNTSLTLATNEFCVSYKDENVGRGMKGTVLTLYDVDEEKIIKLFGDITGWRRSEISNMFFLFKELGVKELT